MQNAANDRKRPAPGTSPLIQQQNMASQPFQPIQQLPDTTDFSNFDFSNPMPTGLEDPNSAFNVNNNFNFALNNAQPPIYGGNNIAQRVPSTELVRRSRNQQLAPQTRVQPDQWNGFGNTNAQVQNAEHVDDEDEADLDRRVALAKKDAAGKRKNILPFVQKLSSFLDNNNTDLIRWSDDGRSFIVLDEDEFARTLIPEVFKHNNYASFVRQLNMYGFHKTVNITDGSLRQSEKARKGVKPPSMYSHPFFRRNRPDLLWLVQKPAGGAKGAKRKREGGDDSDEGRQYSPVPESGPLASGANSANQDVAQLPRNELVAVRRELQNLQTQQKFISQMITQLREQNDQFYRQATAFQALHDRHENSINAILTFLATFYRQGLEGHGAQNLVNMFTNPPGSQQQHGSVVEEFHDNTPTPVNNQQVQRFVKKPPLLLPGPAAPNTNPGSAVTEASSARPSQSPPNDASKPGSASNSAQPDSAKPPQTPVIKNEAQTPNQEQMMNLINNVNASTSQASTPNTSSAAPAVDMNSIVDRIKQNNSPLTAQQRDDMVNSVLGNTNNSSSSSNANAVTSYKNATDSAEQWKEQIDQSHHALDYLQQLQRQQDEKVQELNRRLQPLSPTGTIPGLHNFTGNGGEQQDFFDGVNLGAPGDYDPAAFINFDEPQPWELGSQAGGEEDAGNFDFDFDAAGNSGGDDWTAGLGGDMFGGVAGDEGVGNGDGEKDGDGDGARVESLSGSEAASPAAPAAAAASGGGEETGHTSKRTRRS